MPWAPTSTYSWKMTVNPSTRSWKATVGSSSPAGTHSATWSMRVSRSPAAPSAAPGSITIAPGRNSAS